MAAQGLGEREPQQSLKTLTSRLCPLPHLCEEPELQEGQGRPSLLEPKRGPPVSEEQTPGLQGPPWLLLTTGLGLRSPRRPSEPLGAPSSSAQFLLQAG